MAGVDAGAETGAVDAGQLETVLAGTRAVGAIIAESLASVETVVSMPQLRVLIMAGRAPQSMTSVAEDLGVHASNATRTCERLVQAGLLDRRIDENDRRRVVITLTSEGRSLVEQVMEHRRERLSEILAQMDPAAAAALASSLAAFTAVMGTEGDGPHPVPLRHA